MPVEKRSSQAVPETIQCSWLDPANRMSCLGSDQEYLPSSLFGCFDPLVRTEGPGSLFYISTYWALCRHLRGDRLGHIWLRVRKERFCRWLRASQTQRYSIHQELNLQGHRNENQRGKEEVVRALKLYFVMV